jgi:SAM-dependent methyltransferase
MKGKELQHAFERRIGKLLHRVDEDSHPNLNPLALQLRDAQNLAWNIKFFGYELARQLAANLPLRQGIGPSRVGLKSKPSTQTDIESDWAAHWFQELKVPVIFHRKLWELSYVLQALYESDMVRAGARGLGFGCGAEPVASYLAAQGVDIVATDLPPTDREAQGWAASGQHASVPETMFHPHLVTREMFDQNVHLKFVDMNALPPDLTGFDFCWSICALEHLGSIERGMDFISNAMESLRPGGIAIHTTEFNFLDDKQTLDNWPTVLFQRQHFEAIAERLNTAGHHVAALDFDVGSKPLDRFIDLPPYPHDWPAHLTDWAGTAAHLKLSIDGFVSTCFGMIIRKQS